MNNYNGTIYATNQNINLYDDENIKINGINITNKLDDKIDKNEFYYYLDNKIDKEKYDSFVNDTNNNMSCIREELTHIMYELNKKEEERKMNANKILEMYMALKKEKQGSARNKEIEELRNQMVTANKIEEMKENFLNEILELLKNDESKEVVATNKIDGETGEAIILTKVEVSGLHYKNISELEEYQTIIDKYKKEELEILDNVARCQAMLAICSTKEEIEDILLKYSIIDKKGKILA